MHLRNHENLKKMKHKNFTLGGFCPGGFCLGGFCQGAYVRRVFVQGVFVLEPKLAKSSRVAWPLEIDCCLPYNLKMAQGKFLAEISKYRLLYLGTDIKYEKADLTKVG